MRFDERFPEIDLIVISQQLGNDFAAYPIIGDDKKGRVEFPDFVSVLGPVIEIKT